MSPFSSSRKLSYFLSSFQLDGVGASRFYLNGKWRGVHLGVFFGDERLGDFVFLWVGGRGGDKRDFVPTGWGAVAVQSFEAELAIGDFAAGCLGRFVPLAGVRMKSNAAVWEVFTVEGYGSFDRNQVVPTATDHEDRPNS